MSGVEERFQFRGWVLHHTHSSRSGCSGCGVTVHVAAHAQQLRQPMQENPPHPGGHAVMCRGGAVVDVDGKDGDDDGECDEDHGEDQILPDERDGLRGGGDDLLDDQEENRERHQDWGAERDLLAAVGGQVEDEDGEEGQADAGDDEEEGVEKRQPADDEKVGDGGIGRAAVGPQTTAACGLHYLPFTVVEIIPLVHVELLQSYVHLLNTERILMAIRGHDLDNVPCTNYEVVAHLGAIVCPGAKLHRAVLEVKGEEGDVNGAGWLVIGWWCPWYGSIILYNCLGDSTLETAIRTVERKHFLCQSSPNG